MFFEEAVSEIIGAILLISILVAAFGIFAALYIPTLVPEKIPRVSLSIACSNVADPPSMEEYPCTRGSFNCKPFDNETCENDCKWRDYSLNTNLNNDGYQDKISQCMENCLKPICSNISDCKTLYFCHNGGDSLKLEDLSVVVNGNIIIDEGKSGFTWQLKKFESEYFINLESTPSPTSFFENGDSFRIRNPSGWKPIDVVMIVYTLPSGGKVNLIMNQFGTDIE
ncbi:type IV pilin N-terminal domain-containing protein [Methanospirillum stamsii]|uniref:Archaeal Type IV pilin N-terminal domain-containing protein n=1 Tax=Methanospirillum stamsii TaxID=1277351 RepID=A0A2V2NJI8_9EURY|nr:type IV pilin N-terminal domain-containing protein [Methanospirillum stamsii]PWR75493.1 hypothetical protein DLD82_05030 [Methanospirillum stamsii]